jgi:inner membrane protein
MLLGAIYQSIPDVDFLASFFLSPSVNLLVHRGFTHSFPFVLIAAFALSYIGKRWHSKEFSITQWMIFVGLEMSIHLVLDSLNAYGVGWFEPFTHLRVGYNIVFVADPLYSIGPGIACVALLIFHQNHRLRSRWAWSGIALSSLYLCFCIFNKTSINHRLEVELKAQNIAFTRYLTTPTAFNNLLWYCVAESDSGFYIGYRSVFDRSAKIEFQFFARNRSLLASIESQDDVKNLVRFSKGYYTVESRKGNLVFNDLRFGRIAGWENPEADFTFHFYLQSPEENRLVVQRGRFAEWNYDTMHSLVNRIQGI